MAPGSAPRGSGMGCATMIAIGFGVIVLLGLITCGGAAYWAISPGKQTETARLVGEESVAYFEVGDLSTSKPVAGLLRDVFQELDRRGASQNPATPEWLRSLQSAQRDYQSMLDYVLPNSFMLTLEPTQSGLDWVSAANFPSFTRPAQLMLAGFAADRADGSGPLAQARPYGDVTIYEFAQGIALGFLGGTFVAGGSAPSVQKGVDRLRETQPRRPPLLNLEPPRAGSWDARGVVSGLAVVMLDLPPEQATMARLGLRMDDPDTATGYLVVDGAGEEEAASLEQALAQRLAERAAELEKDGLRVEYKVVRNARAVDVDLKLQGVHDFVLSQLEPTEAGGEAQEAEEAPAEEDSASSEDSPASAVP